MAAAPTKIHLHPNKCACDSCETKRSADPSKKWKADLFRLLLKVDGNGIHCGIPMRKPICGSQRRGNQRIQRRYSQIELISIAARIFLAAFDDIPEAGVDAEADIGFRETESFVVFGPPVRAVSRFTSDNDDFAATIVRQSCGARDSRRKRIAAC